MPAQVTLSSGHILNMAVELIGRAIAGDPDSAYYHSDLVRTYATLEDKKERCSCHSAMPCNCNWTLHRSPP